MYSNSFKEKMQHLCMRPSIKFIGGFFAMKKFIVLYVPNKPNKKTSDTISITMFIIYCILKNQTKKFGGVNID